MRLFVISWLAWWAQDPVGREEMGVASASSFLVAASPGEVPQCGSVTLPLPRRTRLGHGLGSLITTFGDRIGSLPHLCASIPSVANVSCQQ